MSIGWEIIKSELKILKNRGDSRNPILRIIPGPTRLEFLTTLAIKLKMQLIYSEAKLYC